jgi:NitT/TauT family transport system permease protein
MRRWLKGAFGAILVLAAWEATYSLADLPPFLLPGPEAVARTLFDQRRILLLHAWTTAYETVVGFAAALVVGMAAAVVLHAVPRVTAVLWPSILLAQITPKVAIAPLLLVWLGFGLMPKIIIAFLISFFPILANAYAGLQSLSEEVEELARSMRAGRLTFFIRFEFPHALPYLFAGARIAITFALVGSIVAEFVGADKGLGYLTMLTNRLLNSPLMVSSLLVLGGMGAILYGAVGLIERLMIPWHVSQRHSDRELAESRSAAGSL